jgi:fumarylacetoacetase
MPSALDHTHDPRLRSWVKDANGHPDFPIQNLPLGIFRAANGAAQAGIAIGDHILPLRALVESGVLGEDALAACHAAEGTTLNRLLGLGARYRIALREAASAFLAQGTTERHDLLYPAAQCELLLPAAIGDYTDFYAGIVHAENVGRLFRPENPLLPNYKWVPIGYHGRSSSVRVSGLPVRRPNGQRRLSNEATPSFGPARKLDFELELGIWIGPGTPLGETISIEHAADHIAGYCLLNDWSARDMQTWEYQPLGPFLAKSFHTTVSGWIVTPEALAPFRQPQTPRTPDTPQPLPYLFSQRDQAAGALNLELEVFLTAAAMRDRGLPPQCLTRSHAESLFWTPAQLVTHHASNGCNLAPGDLLGTGTISSPTPDGCGSLLELTRDGAEPITLSSGESRHYLENGDEVILRAQASREGFVSIGFGECRASILASNAL